MRPTPLILIIIVVLIVFAPVLMGRFYAIGDIRDVYIPIESFFHEQQLAGHLPAWMPDAAWGFPVIASAQIGFFYPPLLILRLLPLPVYFPILIISHFIWMSWGTYLLIRKLRVSKVGALIGVFSFSLGGFVVLHLTHLNIILALSWLPWQLLVCYWLSSRSIGWRSITFLAFIFGLPFLAGQLQIPTLIAIVSSIWFIFLRYQRGRSFLKTILILVAVAMGAFILASAQLLPSLELMSLSTRGSDSSFDVVRANQHSYPLYHLPTLVFPRFYANDDTYWGKRLQIEYGFYLGTIPLFLSFIGLRLWRRKQLPRPPKREYKFFFYLFIVSFLLAIGSLSPFRLIKIEPSLWVFSAPARWLLFTSFSLSVFAAFGFDHLMENRVFYKKYITGFIGLFLIMFVLVNAGLFIFDGAVIDFAAGKVSETQLEKIYSMQKSAQRSSASLLSPYSYLPLLSLSLLLLFLKHKNLKYLVLILVVAELVVLFVTTTPTLPWSEIIKPPASYNLLPTTITSRQSRLYSVRDGGDTGAYFTNPDSRADDKVRNQQRNLFLPLSSSLFGIAGIEWPASLDLSGQAKVLESVKVEGSYEISDEALARELNIGAVLSLDDDSIKVDRIEHKPRLELVGEKTSKAIVYPATQNPANLSFQVNADTDASVIMRDSFYPGWHAYIDNNEEVSVQKYMTIFRRIFVPAGEHSVTLKYKPIPLYVGVSLTLLFFLIFLITNLKSFIAVTKRS